MNAVALDGIRCIAIRAEQGGTGARARTLRDLAERLAPLRRERSPFADEVVRERARAPAARCGRRSPGSI